MNILLILVGKLIIKFSKFTNLGNGSTWPGHIALFFNKNFIKEMLTANSQKQKTILIAGTNGKTTTGKLIQTILERNSKKVFQNQAGANLLNGIASSLIQRSNIAGRLNYDDAIFEVDENTLSLILKEITPSFLILLNIFRDQLDRYGEINIIAKNWKKAIGDLSPKTTLLLNADDPQIAFLGKDFAGRVFYFGLNDPKLSLKEKQHAADSIFCPNCNSRLVYKTIYFSHLGDWQCTKCSNKRPRLEPGEKLVNEITKDLKLYGTYNKYNLNAAVLFAQKNNIDNQVIRKSLSSFSPAFGRQEIIKTDGKKVQIFLSKNPTSFNESLRTVRELRAKHILFVLNDRIPDGRDVSWIWDTSLEEFISHFNSITVSGDRCYDMGLRIKYASSFPEFQVEEDLQRALALALEQTPQSETLYTLPTYSAMLEVRKILVGKKIL